MVSIVCYWMKETKSNRDSLHAWEVPEAGKSPRSGSLRGRGLPEVGDIWTSESIWELALFQWENTLLMMNYYAHKLVVLWGTGVWRPIVHRKFSFSDTLLLQIFSALKSSELEHLSSMDSLRVSECYMCNEALLLHIRTARKVTELGDFPCL